jgi:phosphoribosylamine--glycine ligase
MSQIATCIPPPDGTDIGAFADLAEELKVDLTIIGPENLLVDGLADHFLARGLRVFGPTAAAAKLEGSKIWAKEIMQRVGIPTASWREFRDAPAAKAHASELGWRCVVKADGLAAGKGSFVCTSEGEVDAALEVLLGEKRFGDKPILVEELLDGQEVSVFAVSDGRTVVPFGAAQDHKRAGENDEGPNTGGMGAYSPVNHMVVAQGFAESFFEPIVSALSSLGTPFVGVLYAGAIVTDQGPKILEFNCRFGDPEAEVLLSRLDDDLADLLWSATSGDLHKRGALKWKTQDALCVVIATQSYPREGDFGTPISGVEEAQQVPDVFVFHAGTDRDPTTGELVTNGGRILTVTALGGSLDEARTRAYQAVDKIDFAGKYYRRDIATKATGTMWEAFGSEWRKPPNWELRMMQISRAIGEVASGLERLQLEASHEGSTELQSLRDRLYEIKLKLHSSRGDTRTESRRPSASIDTSPVKGLSKLSAEFDAMFERMQTLKARQAVDAAFRASPSDYDAIIASREVHGKRE